MKVVAFNGSSRKNGNTAILLRRVLAELEAEGIETELVQLAGKRFAGCTACKKCAETLDDRCTGLKEDGLNECIEKMLAADGILIGSSYWNIGIGRDIGDVENDEEGLATMVNLGRTMAWALKKLTA
jgi:multimeric flavodoxin WrbA